MTPPPNHIQSFTFKRADAGSDSSYKDSTVPFPRTCGARFCGIGGKLSLTHCILYLFFTWTMCLVSFQGFFFVIISHLATLCLVFGFSLKEYYTYSILIFRSSLQTSERVCAPKHSRSRRGIWIDNVLIQSVTPLGYLPNFACNIKWIWANYLTSISPEIIRKPVVFWWFQGE